MKYEVVCGQGINEKAAIITLKAKVNALIEEGYKLLGGISAIKDPNSGWVSLYQALIKE